jgi:hypothetical protein
MPNRKIPLNHPQQFSDSFIYKCQFPRQKKQRIHEKTPSRIRVILW